ncbi:SDR family NAD(P)-dependent oxidoreductase [Dactylosporangium sp. CA-092794]|uniref:SDR family NAD(P)-dependent oxidoreductase n=1 Tax=Dactylosporangium sp. CA-092794 TaxID=3239929 RepID=UPI003D8E2DC0
MIGTSRVAVVTGASSGIGAATALRLARGGLTVALVARRADRLADVAAQIAGGAGTAAVYPADLTEAAAREQVITRIAADLGPIGVLVNNAGHGYYGAFAAMPWPAAQNMIELNAAAPVHLSGLVLPHMLTAGAGHIVNIGSGGAHVHFPGLAMYTGTKAFLAAHSTAVHRELRRAGVHVSLLRCGDVSTEFFDSMAARSIRIPREPRKIPAERVAEAVWRVLQRPRRLVCVPGSMRLVAGLEQWLGRLLDRAPLDPNLRAQLTGARP